MDTCQAAVPCGLFQTSMQTVWTATPPLVQKKRNQFAKQSNRGGDLARVFRTDNRPARCSCLILSHFFFLPHCCCFLNSRRISWFDRKKPERSDSVWSKRFSRGKRAVLSFAPARWARLCRSQQHAILMWALKSNLCFFPLARRPWVCGAIGLPGRRLRGYRHPLQLAEVPNCVFYPLSLNRR